VWTIATDAKGTATAQIQPVKVALAEGQVTILDSGLKVGENVVVDGADRLQNGQIVIVSAARKSASQSLAGQDLNQADGPFRNQGNNTPKRTQQ
jgi:multidrug efflux system membrane fusion protein